MNTDVQPAAAPLSSEWKRSFRRRLLAWFERHARDLPWRRTRDPYAIWVSEIMLQQTQVATVEGYYHRFLAAFPTVALLAAADEHDVLRLWEGLGYYRRARQMHAAARAIVADHHGRFPREFDDVRSLPGIGRYTAGAITSIAYDTRAPILEANTYRLFARLIALEIDPQSKAGQETLWDVAEDLLPARGAGIFNQALMELGSLVCTPRSPQCEACPVASLCPTRERGLQHVIPKPRAKPTTEAVRDAAVVVRRRGKVLLVRYGDEGRWAGLWDFPRFTIELEPNRPCRRRLIAGVSKLTGVKIEPVELLTTITHGVTRFRITLECHLADYSSGDLRDADNMRWVAPAALADYPLSTTGRKLARLVSQ